VHEVANDELAGLNEILDKEKAQIKWTPRMFSGDRSEFNE
jgi:hypothetical protein